MCRDNLCPSRAWIQEDCMLQSSSCLHWIEHQKPLSSVEAPHVGSPKPSSDCPRKEKADACWDFKLTLSCSIRDLQCISCSPALCLIPFARARVSSNPDQLSTSRASSAQSWSELHDRLTATCKERKMLCSFKSFPMTHQNHYQGIGFFTWCPSTILNLLYKRES